MLLEQFLGSKQEVSKNTLSNPKNKHGLARDRRIHFCNSPRSQYGLFTIRLNPDASKICTITFPWGKYSYKRLLMGNADSPDIFQGKRLELMKSLEYARATFSASLS
jgi:hypothetical protein